MYRRAVSAFLIAVFVGTLTYFNSSAAAPTHQLDIVPSIDSATSAVNGSEAKSNTNTTVVQATPSAQLASAHQTPIREGNNLSIESIGFRAPIVDVGTTSTNNIDVPAGMQVGRWTGSATPGSPGAVFLDGHVDGVFARLHTLTVGQSISVSYGGQAYTYRAIHKEVVQLAGIDMRRALSVMGYATEGLNIMTCAGTYIPSMGTYDQRLVIYAVRE